jgi:TrmH family RNA methyltransferase
MGSIFGIELVRATHAELLGWSRRTHAHVLGTSAAAPLDYRGAAYQRPLVLVIGAERGGMTPSQLDLCDEVVRIPMLGAADSLNVAVAAGVVLYHALDRHRPHRRRGGRRRLS